MTPVKVAMFCVALNFVLNVVLIWTPLRTSGLAWSTAICAVIQASMLIVLIRKQVANPVDREVMVSWLKTALLTLVMGAVVATVTWILWDPQHDWIGAIWTLAAGVGSGVVVFGFGSVMLSMPELHWVLGKSK